MTVQLEAQRTAALKLLGKVAEDAAALQLAATHDSLASIACFHAQQAVEKIAKAALALRGVDFPSTTILARSRCYCPLNTAIYDKRLAALPG